jgi:hypothetical protein
VAVKSFVFKATLRRAVWKSASYCGGPGFSSPFGGRPSWGFTILFSVPVHKYLATAWKKLTVASLCTLSNSPLTTSQYTPPHPHTHTHTYNLCSWWRSVKGSGVCPTLCHADSRSVWGGNYQLIFCVMVLKKLRQLLGSVFYGRPVGSQFAIIVLFHALSSASCPFTPIDANFGQHSLSLYLRLIRHALVSFALRPVSWISPHDLAFVFRLCCRNFTTAGNRS